MLFAFTFSRDFCIGVPLVATAILLYGGACDMCIPGGSTAGGAAEGLVAPSAARIAPRDAAEAAAHQKEPLLERADSCGDDSDDESPNSPR